MTTLVPPVKTVVPLDIVLDVDPVDLNTGVIELATALAPPVKTVVPLDIALDFDPMGVGKAVVELSAPLVDLSISLDAFKGGGTTGVVELSAPITDLSIQLDGLGGVKGDKGDKGDTGEQGPPGEVTITGALSYTHSQGTPLVDWPIQHNLGYDPAGIEVRDGFGSRHKPAAITYSDPNNLILHFSFAFGGTAKLS